MTERIDYEQALRERAAWLESRSFAQLSGDLERAAADELKQFREENSNLAIMVRRLCLRHPSETLKAEAHKYLCRIGRQGSCLRGKDLQE